MGGTRHVLGHPVPPDVHLWVQVFIGWIVILWQQSAALSGAT